FKMVAQAQKWPLTPEAQTRSLVTFHPLGVLHRPPGDETELTRCLGAARLSSSPPAQRTRVFDWKVVATWLPFGSLATGSRGLRTTRRTPKNARLPLNALLPEPVKAVTSFRCASCLTLAKPGIHGHARKTGGGSISESAALSSVILSRLSPRTLPWYLARRAHTSCRDTLRLKALPILPPPCLGTLPALADPRIAPFH